MNNYSPEAGNILKNVHTRTEKTVDRVTYEIVFTDGDRWNKEDINIHWQNISKNEPDKKFGQYGYLANIKSTPSGLMILSRI